MKTITPSASKWLLVLILSIYPFRPATGSVIYVDANAAGANNGSSWTNAYKYLKDALTAGGSGDSIYVAQGTYRPDANNVYPGGTKDRTATFQLKNGVTIYGGYPNGGGSRNPNIYKTILSGDINIPDANNDNSYHVVTGSGTNSSAILDGFTITAGNADGPSAPLDRGGGMYNSVGSPTVSNCTFSDNSSSGVGGGIFDNYGSCPTLTNCTITGNSSGYGGGIRNNNNCNAILTNCTFIGNSAPEHNGGGIYDLNSSSTLINCTFIGNSARNGGGVCIGDGSNTTLTNCTFTGNSATGDGGGMYILTLSSFTLTNCTFSSNSANYGGGMYNSSSNPVINNCILWGNTALSAGPQINGTPTVSFSDVQGGWTGTGNIDADPLFVDANGPDDIFGTEDDNLRLLSGSPCIDDANNYAVPGGITTDLDGLSRFVDDPMTNDTGNGTPPIVDMGAYEYKYEGGPIIFVDANATGANNGTSWANAYQYLQDALYVVEPNYEIWVAQGTYRPDETAYEPDGNDYRGASFVLENGVAIYGGFPAGGGNWASRDPNAYQTILSGDLSDDDVYVSDPCNLLNEPTRAENSYHVVYAGSSTDETAVLDGFTIKAGNANNTDVWPGYWGGGMFNLYANCTVNNCTFTENSAGNGGAMHNNHSNSNISNCIFYRNSAVGSGGGIDFYQSSHPTLTNCTFTGNSALWCGGGVNNSQSNTEMNNCIFIDNVSSNGGGVSNVQSNADMSKCSFSNNTAHSGYAGGGGGGISNINWSSPTITDCNFIGNSAVYGGGINDWNNTSTTVTNCTFTGNSSTYLGGGMKIDQNCYMMLTECNFIGNTSSTGKGLYSAVTSVIDLGTGGNIFTSDEFYVGGSSEVQGTGSIVIGLGGEMIVDSNAIVDMNDPCYPGAKGTIRCDGFLNVKGNGQLRHADVNVTRQTDGFFGKLKVEGSAQVTDVNIFADGDRFMEVDPCTFTGTIANNRIYVTITEGRNGTPEGVLEVRGKDFNTPPCPNQACQIDAGNMPDFNTISWTLERLALAPGARLNLVDRFSSGNGTPEVLYVKNLVLGADSNLSVGFEHLYYANISGDPNSLVKVSLFGFSLGDINSNSTEEFASRVSSNNYIDPVDPYKNKIYVERVTGLEPDPNGMMKMSNLQDSNGQLISARAKGEFAPVTEDEIRIRLDYLFTTTDPNTYMSVYLTDIPELGDLNDLDHYKEVARIPAPPYPRPGSAGSGRFGNFEKFVPTFGLDLTRGTWIELVLVEPQSQILKYGVESMGYAPMEGGGTVVYTNDWDAGVYCWLGICLDLDWSGEPDVADFLIVISGNGGNEPSCADGSLSGDGYEDSYDNYSWDWTINLEERLNMCGFVPMKSGGQTFAGGDFGHFGGTLYFFNPSDLNDLLISGKRGTTDEPTKMKDRHYIFDRNYHYLELNEPATENRNIRVVRGTGDDLYQINSKTGISRLEDNGPVVTPYETTFTGEPRYNRHSTVYVGVQGTGDNSYGRPILDAAFDTKDANYVYVVPVVVIPDCDPPYDYNLPYTAAARVRLTEPYDINKLYDEPPLPGDNQRQYRNTLREIECDGAGNVFVTNANAHNQSDILWKFEPNQTVRRLELDLLNPPVRAPVGLCVSSATNMLYVASAVYNSADPNSQKIYCFSTADLSPLWTLTVHRMQHVTGIAEDPVDRALWITGFNMNCAPPKRPSPIAAPFYDPYLANVTQGINEVNAICILDANHPEYDLAMPLSIVWTGSRHEKCGGADLNGNGEVNLQDFVKLAQYWLSGSCVNLNNCDGADLEPEVFPDGDVDLRDFDVMAEYWLDTGCQ